MIWTKKHPPLLTLVLMVSVSSFVTANEDKLIEEGKLLIQQFAGELKSSLQTAIKAGGLTSGIEACHLKAPLIAQKHSQANWTVSRTSLKPRNANNAPDTWEAEVLERFEQDLASGKSINQLIETRYEGNSFRLMSAIPTQGLCLSCHGQHLSSDVKGLLNNQYPEDKAIGYQEGEIRGAFSLKFSAE